MNRTASPDQRDRFVRWWLVAIAAAVLVNAIQFPAVESSASRWYKAISPYGSGDVREIAASHGPTVRRNYGLEFTLAKWTSRATLTVFPGSSLAERSDMYVAFYRVEVADYEPTLSPSVASTITDQIVAIGKDKELGEYGIAVGPDGTAEQFILVFDGGRPIITDRDLLPKGFGGGSA